MKLKNVADVVFSFPVRGEKDAYKEVLWLTTQNLMENNVIKQLEINMEYVPDSTLRVAKGDIIMRRVRPQFVNYIDSEEECYLGQNLMLIRANELINAKYLAYIIDMKLLSIGIIEAGSVIPAISRKDLLDIDIGTLPSMDKQKAIGELWWLQMEKMKKSEKLLALEQRLLKAQLKQLVKNLG